MYILLNYKKALKQFENAIIQNPEYSKAYTGIGHVLVKTKQTSRSVISNR